LEAQGVYGTPASSAGNLTGNPTHDPHLAAIRAQHNIVQKFGPALQPGGLQPRPPGAGGLMLPATPPPQQLPRPAANVQHNAIPQHDGGDDLDDHMLISVEGYGSLTRQQADKIFLKKVRETECERNKATEEIAQALEKVKVFSKKNQAKGKGKAHRARRRMDAYDEALNADSSYPYPSSANIPSSIHAPSALQKAVRIPQLDGDSDSDDVVDEDAINSDLDDPEDDEIDNDDDDEVPQIMLCMYDKVQRTKNKWKCVLKDGVLTINGQEYVVLVLLLPDFLTSNLFLFL
jgi:transcription initiation factor TFIIA large subunit